MPHSDSWWLDIRFSRSSPPGFAAYSDERADESDERAAVYTAALQQFEELMVAAEATGTAARPLPLFYALSQAGRAITAAHHDGDGWNHHGHGLTVQSDTYVRGLRAVVATTAGTSSSFQVVRRTVGSPDLAHPAMIGALMMSLPENVGVPVPELRWNTPLEVIWPVHDPNSLEERLLDSRVIEAIVRIGPNNMEPGDVAGSIEGTLADYPTATGWRHPPRPGIEGPQLEAGSQGGVFVWWTGAPPLEIARAEYVDRIAPEYRFHGERWLWPSVHPTETVLLSPLMTWWVLLFGFSMFARYEPSGWSNLINIESSGWAVAIEHTLESAITAVPRLVRDALFQSLTLENR